LYTFPADLTAETRFLGNFLGVLLRNYLRLFAGKFATEFFQFLVKNSIGTFLEDLKNRRKQLSTKIFFLMENIIINNWSAQDEQRPEKMELQNKGIVYKRNTNEESQKQTPPSKDATKLILRRTLLSLQTTKEDHQLES
jgi:hypothetical protein